MTEATTATQPAPTPARQRPEWCAGLDPLAKPVLWRSVLDIATSVVPYLLLCALMFALIDSVSYWWILALAVPASGFLLRTFIVFHDCTHGSFMPTRRANNWLGTFCGLLVYSPFHNWRQAHAAHHGSAGDLDRRGEGDVHTETVAEYQAKSWQGRMGYWLFRHPIVMFGIGPIWSLLIAPRRISHTAGPKLRRSVIGTNIALAIIVTAFCLLFGWKDFLLVQAPMIFLAGTAGVWLFYVQHQFEDVYWENSESWNYDAAALQGSSYLKLPQPLQFFTGNIGLHHVHHLNARIPNYNLQRAHDRNEVFHNVPVLTLWDGMKSVRLKLIDEDSGRLVTFAEARRMARAKKAAPSRPAAELG
jgi:omega-6 fatty acid desaturase (delta-12 desaturase)